MERFDATRAMDICGNFDVLMKQMDDGQFVRYKDHQQALAAAQERIKVLEAALKYRRFGDTATLFERCVDMLEGRDRELELLKGEKWTSLYLNHFRNAIAGMRTALKEPPCS